MAFSVQMPALGESVTEGTVTRWLKQEGDHVEVDEPLLEVSTDKVDTEIPSPVTGTLERIVVAEDETADVGAELAVIGDRIGGGAGSPAEDSAQAPAEQAQHRQQPEQEAARNEFSDGQQSSGGGDDSDEGTEVIMPALGESVTEGTVTRWLKQVGDQVAVDEPLLEVSTDKVDTEVPSPVAGTLLEISAGEDETVDVGGRLALIGSRSTTSAKSEPLESPRPSAEISRSEPEAATEPEPRPNSEPEPSEPAQSSDGDSEGSPYVTPLVRKLAAEHGVNLGAVHGTGVGGRIRKQDVLAAAEPEPEPAPPAVAPAPPATSAAPTSAPAPTAAAPAPAPSVNEPSADAAAELRGTTQKMSRLRRVIAERMVESLQVAAQLTTVVEVDVTKVAQLRQRAKAGFEAREGVKLSFLPFFVKATIDALKLYPVLNASIDMEQKQITYHGAEHLGIAVDTNRGLIVPVLRNAGDLNLAGLARGITDLAERTRTNKILPDELSGGTFTITNIGSVGALTDTPIINQPQVGILGTGAVVKRPVVVTDSLGQDAIAIRSIASLVLTYDHRLVDGADAARFLGSVKRRIETAAFEAEIGLG
jgi:pyruvate dehydrogenase E2 component (dihydrolipoamide acetyltransferase)